MGKESGDAFAAKPRLSFNSTGTWIPTHDEGRNIDCILVNGFLEGAVTIRQFGVAFSDHDCFLLKIDLPG